MDRSTHIQEKLSAMPDLPGVYQFFNVDGKIIYVGKAKNLKKRVHSYFNKSNQNSAKLQVLVTKIYDIQHIVVDTESDALLLENNFIKKFQPRYNVLLKDDKTYPWICIKNERFPKVFTTRNMINDGSKYFGPFTSLVLIRTLLDLIKQIFPLRNCNYDLSEEKVKSNKYKVCLEYHLGNCKAPCIGLQDSQEYDSNINQISSILKGNISEVIVYLKDMMKTFSAEYKFEEAQKLKDKIEIIEKYQSKSTIVSTSIHNVDVFSFLDSSDSAYVNYLRVVNGAIVQSHSIEISKKLDESKEELLSIAITDIRQKLYSESTEIIVPFEPEMNLIQVKYYVPQKGDKLKLLELSERNLMFFKAENEKRKTETLLNTGKTKVVEQLMNDLKINQLPIYIECFDNSNIQGTNPVSSCVVYKNGKPLKSEYRHFNVKTVEGPNDFASMEEVVYRRYKRQLEENNPLPQLIIIDGGKGQLSAAVKSLEKLSLSGKIAIIGIAKKLEEIFKPGDSVPLYLDKKSTSLKLIQQMRDEAHRFGITFHRDKRSQGFIKSQLDEIKGIGESTKEALLIEFKTVENIKNLTLEKLTETIGKAKAEKVFNFFKDL